MQRQRPSVVSTTLLLLVLPIALPGCSRIAPPAEPEKKPEARPPVVAAKPAAVTPPPVQAAKPDKNPPAIPAKPEQPAAQITTVALPAAVDAVKVGASGQRLICQLENLAQLAVIDVKSGKIAGYVLLQNPADLFAASVDKLVVFNRQSRLAKRYSLADLKQEAEKTIPCEFPVVAIGMGARSFGPLFVACQNGRDGEIFAVDPETLQPMEPKVEPLRLTSTNIAYGRVDVSPDGSVFCHWTGDHLSFARTWVDSTPNDPQEHRFSQTAGAYARPDDNGERIYVGNRLISVRGEQMSGHDLPQGVHSIPAIGGPFYLTVPLGKQLGSATHHGNRGNSRAPAESSPAEPCVQVHVAGESKPILSIPRKDLPLLNPREDMILPASLLGWRLFFFPAAQVIAELPTSSNTLLLHHLDLEEGLRRACVDGPVILSRPPRIVRIGETLHYQIQTRTQSNKPVFKLESGPEGMVVSEKGMVQWTPPPQLVFSRVGAVITVGDSGQTKRHTLALTVQPPPDILVSADSGPQPGTLAEDRPRGNLHVKLPAAFGDVCVGGNGQFLVFTFPALQKAGVFDVAAAKITGYVPTTGECLVAAGTDKLVVVDPQHATIERFDLQTQKLENRQTLSLRGEAFSIAMGSASQGPVMVATAKDGALAQMTLLDLNTLTRLEALKKDPDVVAWKVKPIGRVSASADGRVFGILASGFANVLAFTGQELAPHWDHRRYFPGWVVPNEAGDRIGTMYGIQGDRFRKVPSPRVQYPEPEARCYCLPAVHGPLYLQVKPEKSGHSVSVCFFDEEQPLVTLQDLPLSELHLPGSGTSEQPGVDRRIFLIPNAKLIAMLPQGQDRLVLRRFDLGKELEQSNRDYLVVLSRPPRTALPGKTFEYQLDVRSRTGKVKYRLDYGPPGMQLSETGLVRWDAKTPPDARTASVRITLTDGSGRNVQHNFELATGEKPKPKASDISTLLKEYEPGTGASDKPPEWKVTEVDDHRLVTSRWAFTLTPGLHYESMLLLYGEHLAVLSADAVRVLREHTLTRKYSRIAERAKHYVAISGGNASVVDLLDKKTLAPIRSIPLGREWPTDLAIHPTRPISYVAIRPHQNEVPLFVMVDETNGEIRRSDKNLGQQLVIDGAGHRLVSSIQYDMLVYDLEDDGTPRPWGHAVPMPGERELLYTPDPVTLRIAPDGLRATILQPNANSAARNLDALDEKPVEYPLDDKQAWDIAYHPVLPLVACLRPTGPVLFERDTGQCQPKMLKYSPKDFEGATLHHLWFSADGKGLLLEARTTRSRGVCLYRAELDLSKADLNLVRHRLAKMTSLGRNLLIDHLPEPGQGAIPLSEIDALKGGHGPEMSAKDISRAFTDAVVVVRSGERFGTGFVIGASGYVFTCAHCVRESEGITVSCRLKEGGNIQMKNVPAKLLRADRWKDMALLKIEAHPRLPTVRLALGVHVESGERVTIIGHPGAGQTLLDYTVTEGIVSNGQRRIGRQTFLQTSAAVNPGSSGAPMFNASGMVIGLVARKMNIIEGAGFAVPASELAAFLAIAVKATGPEGAIQRQWFDSDYQHETTAQYLGFRDGTVQLRRTDGQEISVPLASLSPSDQSFVRLFQPDAKAKQLPSAERALRP